MKKIKSGVWCGGTNSTRRQARGCCQSGTWDETDLSSPSVAPYKQEARRRSGSERHPEPVPCMHLASSGVNPVANPAQRPPG